MELLQMVLWDWDLETFLSPVCLPKLDNITNLFRSVLKRMILGGFFLVIEGMPPNSQHHFCQYKDLMLLTVSGWNLIVLRSGFKALVDSGSSFTYLPSEVYNELVSEFDKQMNAQRFSLQEGLWDYCYNASSQELHNIPAIQLKFPRNQDFVVHNPTFFVSHHQGNTMYCLSLQPTDDSYGIIGRQDTSDSADVHLAPPPNDKSPNPLPTNEQQSIPRTTAVAPAIAGRTSSESSTASLLIPFPHLMISLLLLLRH
uniref:Xylanase inhibitor C-terminal domain-containing protein n=1 Tax=Salix viminalis TaxID=40686 RepID=A0A6N2MGZ5_SALVM